MPLNPDDQQKIVDAHNAYRSDPSVNTPNLVWDSTLATGAQAWADNMASTHQFQHSPDAQNGTVGENLASGTTGTNTLAQMVDFWGKTVVNGRSEQAQFKPGILPNVSKDGGPVGHYTQVVSRLSTSVGCGIATDTNIDPATGKTTDYLVCRYMQPGNLTGAGYVFPQPVTLAQVSVANATLAAGVDAANNVYYYMSNDNGATWTPQYSISGKQMKQVSVASDLTICGLDTSGAIWQGSFTTGVTWTAVPMPSTPSAFISLSCGSATNLLAVGVNKWTYRYDGSSWTRVPGGGENLISVASDEAYWALDTHGRAWGPGGVVVGGNSWVSISLSIGSNTNRWTVGTDGQYWRVDMSNTNNWTWTNAAPGTGKQVSVASDGTVWTVGTDNRVSRLVNNAWTPLLV